jgi:2'-5' RNA ligase
MEEQKIRAFVAVPIPPETQARVAAIQERLRSSAAVKWVEPLNLHFTLRFLGYTTQAALNEMEQDLRTALATEGVFSLTLSGVGAFPSLRRPHTLWIGVSEGGRELEGLARIAESAAIAHGFSPEERPFRAHLTLGRVKARQAPPELVQALEAEPPGAVVDRIGVEEVVLMRSVLHRSGPTYTPIARFPLARSA